MAHLSAEMRTTGAAVLDDDTPGALTTTGAAMLDDDTAEAGDAIKTARAPVSN